MDGHTVKRKFVFRNAVIAVQFYGTKMRELRMSLNRKSIFSRINWLIRWTFCSSSIGDDKLNITSIHFHLYFLHIRKKEKCCSDWPVGLTSSCSPASQSPSWAAARATLHLQSPVSTSTSHRSGMEARQGHSLSLHTTASPDTDLCTPHLSTNTEWALHWNLKLEKLLFSLLEFESFPASWIKSINCVEIELNIDKWEHRGDQLLAGPASDPPHRVPGSAGGDNLLHLNR